MTHEVEYLNLDDVLELAMRLFGKPIPVRDIGLLGSAVARPQTTVGGDDAYPDLSAKAAALLQSIVNNHALVDGNKRLGWLATAVFLELNGVAITEAGNDQVYELVMSVAWTPLDVDEIATGLRELIGRHRAATAPSVSASIPPNSYLSPERIVSAAPSAPRTAARRSTSAPTGSLP